LKISNQSSKVQGALCRKALAQEINIPADYETTAKGADC